MKNLTNLYVYDGKNAPYSQTDDTSTALTSVANTYVNPGCIAPKIVSAYCDGSYITLFSRSNTNIEMKVLSFSDGNNFDSAAFYIQFSDNVQSTTGSFAIKGLKEESSDIAVPFGESFDNSNDSVVANPMTINADDIYLCCYVGDRVAVKKIDKAKLKSIQYQIPEPTESDQPYTITLSNLISGPNVVFIKTYNGTGYQNVKWVSFMFYVVDSQIGGAWTVYDQDNITAKYDVNNRKLTISGIFGNVPSSSGSSKYQINIFSTQIVY